MRKGHLAGILFSIIFGFTFMFSKMIIDIVTPMGLIAYRFLLAFLFFEALRITKVVKIRFNKKLFFPIFLVVLFQPIMYFIFETYGVALTPSSEAGLMIAFIPVFVTILSAVMLKEKPNKYQIVFITFSFLGIILIQVFKTGDGRETSIIGLVLLLLAVISAALFNIASRSASRKVKPYELTYFMMLYGAVIFNIIYIFQLLSSGHIDQYFSILLDLSIIGPLLYLGIIASIGGFFLVNYALSKLPAHVSSIYSNLSTVVAVIAGYLFLNEAIGWYHIVGGLMIILGVYGTARMNYVNQIKEGDKID